MDSSVSPKERNLVSARVPSHFKRSLLRNIVDALWYIRNADLHRDLQMEMVTNAIGKFAKKHEDRLLHHDNVEAIQLLDNTELVRRLKRKKTPFEPV